MQNICLLPLRFDPFLLNWQGQDVQKSVGQWTGFDIIFHVCTYIYMYCLVKEAASLRKVWCKKNWPEKFFIFWIQNRSSFPGQWTWMILLIKTFPLPPIFSIFVEFSKWSELLGTVKLWKINKYGMGKKFLQNFSSCLFIVQETNYKIHIIT